MAYVRYSKIDDLPNRRISGKITPGCICLEGGAFRGLYTGGVLDALMEADINMACTIGVSAGAMNGIGYACGQIGYASRINLGHRRDPKYVGLGAWKKNKGIIGFDVAFGAPDGLEPLDIAGIPAAGRRYLAVATNCLTGREEYFETNGTRRILKAIQASASMPFLSKMVYISGKPYLDGGCACSIPYEWALKEGFEKIIVVRTRPADFRKEVKENSRHTATHLLYGKYPQFVKSLTAGNANYNRQCEEINRLGEEGRIFVISPSQPVTVGRLEKDVEKLGALYHLGYDDTVAKLDALRAYLEA